MIRPKRSQPTAKCSDARDGAQHLVGLLLSHAWLTRSRTDVAAGEGLIGEKMSYGATLVTLPANEGTSSPIPLYDRDWGSDGAAQGPLTTARNSKSVSARCTTTIGSSDLLMVAAKLWRNDLESFLAVCPTGACLQILKSRSSGRPGFYWGAKPKPGTRSKSL